MPWSTSNRRSRLPKDWTTIRYRVLKRDNWLCQVVLDEDTGEKCHEAATEVDHKRPGDDHRDHNLQAICEWHHQQKSSREGAQARAAAVRTRRARMRRQPEVHPGLLSPPAGKTPPRRTR